MNKLILFGTILFLQGCASVVQHGGHPLANEGERRLALAPFFNATEDQHASRALTELTATALMEKGTPVSYLEAAPAKADEEEAGGSPAYYLGKAKEMQANYLLEGTVHEYHYKTDLNGDPAVGITLRLIDVSSGETVWQGSAAKVGYMFASLTSTAQRAIRGLVSKMAFNKK